MRTLLLNPGLPHTFYSFNKVLGMTGKKAILPPLGLLTVASLLPCDWELELVDMVFQDVSESQWDRSDLIMISGMAVQHEFILEAIKAAKKRGKTVVVGGPWSFHWPEGALEAGADLVVKGEAEVQIGELLHSLKKKDFRRIIQSAEMADMTKSPPPRFDLLEMNSYADMAVQFTRGCPFKCEFCDVTTMLGRKVRSKTPDQVLVELELLYNLGWRRLIFFTDDNFIGNIQKTKELLRDLIPWMEARKRPFNFYTQASVNMAANDDLMEDMYRAGFIQVFIGIETPDEVCLQNARKFQNTKLDLDQVCQKLARAGFQIQAGAILGFDGEKVGSGTDLVNFAEKNHIPQFFITLLQAGPGTDLYARLAAENRLLNIDLKHLSNQTGLINFIPTRPLEEIANEFVAAYDALYKPESYIDRVYYNFADMNPPSVRKPFRIPYLWELKVVAIIIFKNGVLYPSRAKFWKNVFKALWNFPTRIDRFMTQFVLAEHYYDFRNEIHSVIKSQLKDLAPELKSNYYDRSKKVSTCE